MCWTHIICCKDFLWIRLWVSIRALAFWLKMAIAAASRRSPLKVTPLTHLAKQGIPLAVGDVSLVKPHF